MLTMNMALLLAVLSLLGSQVLPQHVLQDEAPAVPAESWPVASDHRR